MNHVRNEGRNQDDVPRHAQGPGGDVRHARRGGGVRAVADRDGARCDDGGGLCPRAGARAAVRDPEQRRRARADRRSRRCGRRGDRSAGGGGGRRSQRPGPVLDGAGDAPPGAGDGRLVRTAALQFRSGGTSRAVRPGYRTAEPRQFPNQRRRLAGVSGRRVGGAVLHRSRSVQGRQRYAWPCLRRSVAGARGGTFAGCGGTWARGHDHGASCGRRIHHAVPRSRRSRRGGADRGGDSGDAGRIVSAGGGAGLDRRVDRCRESPAPRRDADGADARGRRRHVSGEGTRAWPGDAL